MLICCSNCLHPYPDAGLPYRCPVCRGVFDGLERLAYASGLIDQSQPGIWRYRHAFALPADAPSITLGEGDTPLVWADVLGLQMAFKCEYLNPTGSFKDRGSALLASMLAARGVTAAVEDSSGNAGASFAAYAARAGVQAKIFVPDTASGPKIRQMEAYGAQIVRVRGPRASAAEAAQQAAEQGVTYASHAYLPFSLPGYATLAYELVEQLNQAPGTVVMPVGQGGLWLGVARGFRAMVAAGLIADMPFLVGVQVRRCAPLWAVHAYGAAGLGWAKAMPTMAEGISVAMPVRGDAVLGSMANQSGTMLVVEEDQILPGCDGLARLGFYVEPTSAVVWDAIRQLGEQVREPLVAVLTGSGLKTSL